MIRPRPIRHRFAEQSARVFAAVLSTLALVSIAPAQVVLDGTLGPSVTLTGSDMLIPAASGTTVGGNLFHSFRQFDIAAGQSVTFQGPGSIQNVLARVTSGAPSTINGRLRCEIPGADLYLINPAGVVFGPDSTLEVRGSFAVTSADVIRLGAEGRFDARTPAHSVLVTSAPAAFGFLSPSAGEIVVQGNLGVGDGRKVSVTGGTLRIAGGQILAASGQVHFVAARQGDEVAADSGALTVVQPPGDGAAPRGKVAIADGAIVDVSGAESGRVHVRGGSLDIVNGAVSSLASAGRPLDAGEAVPVAVDLDLDGPLTFRNGGFVSTSTTGNGPAGDIHVRASAVNMIGNSGQTFSGIGTRTTATGTAGNIVVDTGDLRLSDGASILATTTGAGSGGVIEVHAASLDLARGATIVSQTRGDGPGGAVGLNITGDVILDGTLTSIATDTSEGSSGDGGQLTLNAARLTVRNLAFISASTNGSGDGGDVNIAVADAVELDGVGSTDAFTGIGANSVPRVGSAPGRGGSVSLSARSLHIREGAGIATKTFGGLGGGRIDLDITDDLLIDATISRAQTGLNAAATGDAADGGRITLQAQSVEMRRGQIIASADLDGGEIEITAPDSVHLFDSAILAEAGGNGGNVTIDPITVLLQRSRVSANAELGNGGNILIQSLVFLASADPETAVTASSDFGLVGSVEINSPDTEIAGAIVKLPGSLASPNALLQPQCGANLAGNVSSFIATGRGGAPLVPGALQPSLQPIARH